ncbi:hypothetical protein FRC11_010281 [Ceratobasidium sp. 423]|nr:hypothetical protein FRC11_010281 [Ceratobasidium sp. 423]
MADLDIPPHGLNRNEPIMIGSSDDEDDNIETRRTRRLGGPQGTPRPRRVPDRNLRIFSPPPPNPAIRFGILQAIPFLDEMGQNELMRMLLDERLNPHRLPFARSRPAEPQEPEAFDICMTHASTRPRLGFTFDFEQPEEEEKPKARIREPVKYKQTIEIPDSPPLGADKGKGKAVEPPELVLDHKEIIEIYSDDEDELATSIASSSQQPAVPVKITSVLICAGCRRPLRTGGDRLWALRCGHMIDSRCYNSLSRPQFSSLPLIARLGSPVHPGPASKRRKANKGKGKAKGVMESHEWACPVKECGKIHKSERMAGEEDWVPDKDNGGIKVFI